MSGLLTMPSASLLENLSFPFPIEVKNTSNSLITKKFDSIIEQEIVDIKFLKLEKIIGKELFLKLSYLDKIFMIETASSIDFGHSIDLEKISQGIKNNDTF